MNPARTEGALLAGVCAGIARTFQWNVWVLRALFLVLLLVKTLWAVAAYAVLALGFYVYDCRPGAPKVAKGGLESPELAARGQRIADLERRFRELERREP